MSFSGIGQEGTFLGHVGGIEESRGAEGSVIRVTVRPEHVNPNGTAHGGLILTLLDFTLGAEVESSLGEGLAGHPITIQLSTSMIGAAALGETLTGTARVRSRTKTMSFVDGEILCGERIIATATAVFRNPRAAAESR